MNEPNTEAQFIRRSDAARILGCSTQTINKWMKKRLIPYYKISRTVFFKESELLAAIEKRKVNHE